MTYSTILEAGVDRKCVCVIPAREGSKRIPLKNIKVFAGKPMIWHSIEAANESNLFDHVFVSTESEKIATVALEGGAEVPFIRPQHLADDYTSIYDVLLHAVQWMLGQGMNLRYLCCIYATAPFTKKDYLRQGYELVSSGNADRAFSVAKFPSTIYRALIINDSGFLEMVRPEYRLYRSQDLPVAYYNAGQFHWYHSSYFNKEIPTSQPAPVLIPQYLAHDINTAEDWELAEKYYYFLSEYFSI